MVACVECTADLQVDAQGLELGEVVICPQCGAELEVLKVSPVKLARATEEEDDWGE